MVVVREGDCVSHACFAQSFEVSRKRRTPCNIDTVGICRSRLSISSGPPWCRFGCLLVSTEACPSGRCRRRLGRWCPRRIADALEAATSKVASAGLTAAGSSGGLPRSKPDDGKPPCPNPANTAAAAGTMTNPEDRGATAYTSAAVNTVSRPPLPWMQRFPPGCAVGSKAERIHESAPAAWVPRR